MSTNTKTWVLLFIIQLVTTQCGLAQGIWGRLRQKAEQIGERVIDQKTSEILRPKERRKAIEKTSEQEAEVFPPVARPSPPEEKDTDAPTDTPPPVTKNIAMIKTDTIVNGTDTVYRFNTQSVRSKDFVAYALTLKGTRYVYGSSDPLYGFDCSGFITHVFNHFNISVPRRTVDFKNAEKRVTLREARPGDIILFTGYEHQSRQPGHMGIVTTSGKEIEFIHAASGKTNAVTTSLLSNSYFRQRFLAVVRVF